MQAVTLWQNSVWVQIGTQDKAVLAKKPQKGIKLNFGTILPPNQGLDDYVQKEDFGQTLLISHYMWITQSISQKVACSCSSSWLHSDRSVS